MVTSKRSLLAVIPARGGSKGLPGKNIRPFAGIPLIAHAVLLAKRCPEVQRVIVSTDSQEIANTARHYGAEVPFIRPANLAQDTTPLWDVLQHALKEEERIEKYNYLMLLDPTTPCRLPIYIQEAFEKLQKHMNADGIVAVSKPDFNPIWHSVVNKGGWMKDLFSEASQLSRRQDAPDIFRINGALYIWRASFMRNNSKGWRHGKNLIYEIPDFAAISIDTEEEFRRAELFVKSKFFPLPWVSESEMSTCAH